VDNYICFFVFFSFGYWSIYYSKTPTLSTAFEFSWILLGISIGCIFQLLGLLHCSICKKQWPQDTKEVIRNCKSKKDRQYNGHKIPKGNQKRKPNDRQHNGHKIPKG
jgi:hypothetical protein